MLKVNSMEIQWKLLEDCFAGYMSSKMFIVNKQILQI